MIHSAGDFADAPLAHQDWAAFERVLWPKVVGAWRLHEATLSLELDLFVLFSSFAAITGNPGQANYAAANSFLDRLAIHRRTLGLAGQVVQWGAWSDVGEAEEQRETHRRTAGGSGRRMVDPRAGPASVRPPGAGGRSRQRGGRRGLDQAGGHRSAAWGPQDFLHGSPNSTSGRAVAAVLVERGALVKRLRNAPASDRERLALDFVREEVRLLLRLPAPPPPEVGFFDLGMDSLMAVELRNRVNRAVAGETVTPASIAFDHPSAARLARYLVDVLAADSSGEAAPAEIPPAEPGPAAGEAPEGLLAEIRAALEDGDA